jgi:hypothetical protein
MRLSHPVRDQISSALVQHKRLIPPGSRAALRDAASKRSMWRPKQSTLTRAASRGGHSESARFSNSLPSKVEFFWTVVRRSMLIDPMMWRIYDKLLFAATTMGHHGSDHFSRKSALCSRFLCHGHQRVFLLSISEELYTVRFALWQCLGV